jgi:hypothetical protein
MAFSQQRRQLQFSPQLVAPDPVSPRRRYAKALPRIAPSTVPNNWAAIEPSA